MSQFKIDKKEIARREREARQKENLIKDRLYILASFVIGLAAVFVWVYNTMNKGSYDVVWLDNDRLDAPTLLTKVDDKMTAIAQDRFVRGFVRRYVAHHFLTPDDSDQFVEKAMGWLHAHSGDEGKRRVDAMMSDIDEFHSIRKVSYAFFYPVNDPSALKIRSSSDQSVYQVEIPGTYYTKTEKGESYLQADLRLVVKRVDVSGIPNGYGTINSNGLIVEDGVISYIEDINKKNEVTNYPLFLRYTK